jgi:Lar family restriction alleviation protein
MSELKRCPFCGKEVEIKEEGDWVEVCCEDCGIAMNRVGYAELIEAWNKRAGG